MRIFGQYLLWLLITLLLGGTTSSPSLLAAATTTASAAFVSTTTTTQARRRRTRRRTTQPPQREAFLPLLPNDSSSYAATTRQSRLDAMTVSSSSSSSSFNRFQISDDAMQTSATPLLETDKNDDESEEEDINDIPKNGGGAYSSFASTQQQSPQSQIGRWESLHGNYVLRPPPERGAPRALVHFLGGALVGAAPHITYRYLLEALAEQGYLIVATPYDLQFDHLELCDGILQKFERIAVPLAQQYGALPVVGVGHSTGALLQVIITSLFPDTPRAANALLAYSNKPTAEATPLLDELVVPFFEFVAARNATGSRRNGSQVLSTVLQLLQTPARGQVPSDELIRQAVRLLLVPPPLDEQTRPYLEELKLPPQLRQVMETVVANAVPPTAGVAATLHDLLGILDQIPSLIDQVADGTRDFVPTPAQVQAAARRAYRARNTLVISFEEDTVWDESDQIQDLLQAAAEVIRNQRPMVQIKVERKVVTQAGHAAPLQAPPSLQLATTAEDLLGPEVAQQQLSYRSAHETVQVLAEWLEASNL